MSLQDNSLFLSSGSNLQHDTACGPSLAFAFVFKVESHSYNQYNGSQYIN